MDNAQSPSHARRQALRNADAATLQSLNVLDSNPLSKYIDLSLRLLQAFQSAVDDRHFDEAYVYGMRFATFSLQALPRHKEWRSATTGRKYVKEKRRNRQQVDKVLSLMENLKQRMDAEELIAMQHQKAREKEEQEAAEKQKKLVEEKAEAERQQKLEKIQANKEEEERSTNERQKARIEASQTNQPPPEDVEKSAMAKLMAMGQSMMSSTSMDTATKQQSRPKASKIPSAPQVKTSAAASTSSKSKQPETKPAKPVKHSPKPTKGVGKSAVVAQPQISTHDTQPKTTAHPTPRKRPLSKEEFVIGRLQQTIEAQEKRLVEIENHQIPALLKQAKQHLALDKESPETCIKEGTPIVSKHRKAALACVAHKKRLEKESDTIKSAIFHMETQQFMLENVLEDRQVQQAMEEAAKAMEAIHESVGGDPSVIAVDISDAFMAAPSSLSSTSFEDLDDEDTLMEELEEWLSPSTTKGSIPAKRQSTERLEQLVADQDDDDEISILSLPSIPKSPLPKNVTPSKTKNLLAAVI